MQNCRPKDWEGRGYGQLQHPPAEAMFLVPLAAAAAAISVVIVAKYTCGMACDPGFGG